MRSKVSTFLVLFQALHGSFARATSICDVLLKYGPPQGFLSTVEDAPVRSSQPATFVEDENGVTWYLKRSLTHPELQTSAEVISAAIYRHFGYLAPETHIFFKDGVRYSASRLLPAGVDTDLVDDMPNTLHWRALRVVAAFLKDFDRLRLGPNNRSLPDGSIALYDFGGTLGSSALGQPKPGAVVSDAIGSYGVSGDIQEVFGSFSVKLLPATHPWRQFTLAEADYAVELFRTLDVKEITAIVETAQYINRRDHYRMIDALSSRRNTIVDHLRHYIDPQASVIVSSYWALQVSPRAMVFDVNANRPTYISLAVKSFVDKLEVKENERVLFRGQDELSDQILAPAYRAWNLKDFTDEQRQNLIQNRERDFVASIRYFQYGGGARVISYERDRAYKHIRLGGMREAVWWDRATGLDALVLEHSVSSGHKALISATDNLAIASRYVEYPRHKYQYRYVYILVVPNDQVVPVRDILGTIPYKSNQDEEELAIKFDATPYIRGVYDTETNTFLEEASR